MGEAHTDEIVDAAVGAPGGNDLVGARLLVVDRDRRKVEARDLSGGLDARFDDVFLA